MRRGEIWWVDFEPALGGEIKKKRPAVILTVNALNRARRTVVVVPLASSPTPRPPIVVAVPSAGTGSMAVCDQLRAVDKNRLAARAGELSAVDLCAVTEAVRLLLGL